MQITSKIVRAGPYMTVTQPPHKKMLGYQVLMIVDVVLPIAVEGSFHCVAVDCLGPFLVTNSGNRYIVIFSDYLTCFPEPFAVPSIDAATIAHLLVNEIMAIISYPAC